MIRRKRKVGYKIAKNGCWEWQNNIRNGRYGGIRSLGGKMMLAHRYYYEQKNGSVPNGFELDHLCKNKICVNPDHLEAVSHAVNVQRGKNTKLNFEKVKKIRKLLVNGFKQGQISKLFHISRANIWSIEKGKIWKNVPDPERLMTCAEQGIVIPDPERIYVD